MPLDLDITDRDSWEGPHLGKQDDLHNNEYTESTHDFNSRLTQAMDTTAVAFIIAC